MHNLALVAHIEFCHINRVITMSNTVRTNLYMTIYLLTSIGPRIKFVKYFENRG